MEPFTSFAIIVSALLLVIILGTTYFRKNTPNSPLPPGPWGVLFLGNILSFHPKRPDLAIRSWAAKYGGIYTIKLVFRRWVVISDPEILREAFSNSDFLGRPEEKFVSIAAGGKYGIIHTDEKTGWSEQRRFTIRHLRDFGFGKQSSMESLIMAEVTEVLETFRKNQNVPFKIDKLLSLAVINALWKITTGKRYHQNDPKLNEILNGQNKVAEELVNNAALALLPERFIRYAPRLLGYERAKEAAKPLLNLMEKIISEHESTLPPPEYSRDFIDSYLSKIKNTTDSNSTFYKDDGRKSLIGVLTDLFQAGSETTSTTLNWIVLYLAAFPEVQEKLQLEIDQNVEQNRNVNLSDRINLPYLEAIILETLRISSIAAFGLPHTAICDTKLRNYFIPKGTWIITNTHGIHHSAKYWNDPDVFMPERFLDQNQQLNTELMSNPAFVPFSCGRRICLGESLAKMQLFLYVGNIFHKFSLKLQSCFHEKLFEPKLRFGVILHPQEYEISIIERCNDKSKVVVNARV